MDVKFNDDELHNLVNSDAVLADLKRRGELVRDEAARRAAAVSRRWSAAMDTETGRDQRGPHVDISWRRGSGRNEEWRGHLFLFGTVQPNHPAHLDVLLGALDLAVKNDPTEGK